MILFQFPLVDSQGKMLLPPAECGEGCPAPVYANPRQALRILKRREMKRRFALSGRLRVGRQVGPGSGKCLVFQGKTLNFHSASLHSGANLMLRGGVGRPAMD